MRIRDEVANHTQHPDESLVEYVRALQELYSRAEPSASDAEKVARAIRQCHPRFKTYLRGRDFADLEALAREARTVQAGLLAELQYHPPPRAEESLEPRCTWGGRAADTHIESRTAYTAVAERGHGVAIMPRALDHFAYEQRASTAPVSLQLTTNEVVGEGQVLSYEVGVDPGVAFLEVPESDETTSFRNGRWTRMRRPWSLVQQLLCYVGRGLLQWQGDRLRQQLLLKGDRHHWAGAGGDHLVHDRSGGPAHRPQARQPAHGLRTSSFTKTSWRSNRRM
ncbi:hypothetical protein HPB47_009559 [Ixodes persulcatus]|uniref:Uncharacterized protein n=1 Tax=Ixodes persulcatus TaxID=34615 RepID=A0AC60P1T0_IXOPE|nr:hypothetical protein HPB47_009559 [Ixodes persulcatus]